MIVLAATHLPLAWTLAPALGVTAALAWYWRRLGRADVPTSRRKIRRVSMILMALLLAPLVVGFSIVDGDVDPQRYVTVWSIAGLLLLGVLLTVVVDVMNNLRLVARHQEQEAVEAAGELLAAIRRRESQPTDGSPQSTQRARRNERAGK